MYLVKSEVTVLEVLMIIANMSLNLNPTIYLLLLSLCIEANEGTKRLSDLPKTRMASGDSH